MSCQKRLDGSTEAPSLHQRIRELFESQGGYCTTARLRDLIVYGEFLTPEEHDKLLSKGVAAEIRTALKARDVRGLPYAAPTEGDNKTGRIWVQRTMWNADHYRVYYAEMRLHRDECEAMMKLLREECQERLGIDIDEDF